MLTQIARFEFRYLLRNPLLWVTSTLLFALFFFSISTGDFELGSEGGLLENAAYATLRNFVMISVFFMFVTTSFVANAVIRDDETGYGPIIRSTPITKFEYVIGRFLGAFAISACCLLLVPLAILLGTVMPWADPAQLGPNRLADHLYGYFLLGLPNIFIHSAVFFALATLTRSMMATYLGVIGFVSGFFFLESAFSDRPELQTAMGIAEPFAARAVEEAARYWTIAERNVMLPELTGALLYNRLLWIGIAILLLVLAYVRFRFADQGMSKRERKQQKAAGHGCGCDPARSRRIGCTRCAPPAGGPSTALGMIPAPKHGNAALRALLWMRTKFEIKQVVLSPAFPVLMAWGLYVTFFVLITQRDPDGKPTYPTTLSLIPEIKDAFSMIPIVIAIYYAGELVWRERDRRTHELIDASPMPNWGYVVPKTFAMALVLMGALLTTVVAAIIIQLSLGHTNLELGKYVLWYVLPATWDMLLVAVLAVFVQALSPHKAVGWGIMVLFVAWQFLNKTINHNLLNYGGSPGVPLSDLNGAGSFWKGAWTFRLYWGAFALLLLVAAHLLWRRGTELRLGPRLARARRGLSKSPGLVAAAALLLFLGTGAYAYYNTNVLNEYRTPPAAEENLAELEKRFGKYIGMPQPLIAEMTLDVSLHPEERRAMTKGSYRLRNETTRPIPEIHIRVVDADLELLNATVEGARLILDDRQYEYRIYRLDRPMLPGEERLLTCETRLWARGFRNGAPNTRIVENGTFLSEAQLMPIIGMSAYGLLQVPATRRKYGLPPPRPQRKLEDFAPDERPGHGRGWAKADITVSTSADQTPIAPGSKVSDVTRDGRRIARFVSGAPIHPRFSIQSARYAEKHRRHKGIDLAVYYHPAHAWNVDRLLDAMAVSMDYFQSSFGPYQFDHFRIVEFPGYYDLAQAFAGTIAYSETVGFTSDYSKPEAMDLVLGMTAHELAHQWWPHQVIGADVEGREMLSETLAQYAAEMVMKKVRGPEQVRRYMRSALDEYLRGRARATTEEPPLMRVAGEDHIIYKKGALAMHVLHQRMGEEAVNRALRNFVAKYKFKSAPYPRSPDLLQALRAEARTAEEQNLITDLFERITLYDLKVSEPAAVRRADGRWDVTVPVEAKKLYADGRGAEREAPLTERIEIALLAPGPESRRDIIDPKDVVLMERRPLRSGRQVLKFVTDRKPLYAGVDPYNFHIDRNLGDNMAAVR